MVRVCLKPLRKVTARKVKKLPIDISKKKVGSGSYNLVYNATIKKGCKDAGKKVIYRRSKDYMDSVSSFKQELKMAITMARCGAGPEIYDAGVDSKNRSFMVLEYFPYSLRQLLDRKDRPKWSVIESSLKGPLKKMADSGVFCSDLKFRNVVVNKMGNKMECKMIDYGDDFCAWGDDVIIPKKYLKGVKKAPNMKKVLYAAMLMMMSINSEKHRKLAGAKKALFSKEIGRMPPTVRTLALLLISHGRSKTGTMRRPISQARHYYKGRLVDSNKIYEIITGDTLKN